MIEPGKTRVMEPILEEKVHNRENTIYQVKWDGVRILCFVEEAGVTLQNRGGRIKTRTFPELGGMAAVSGQPLVLDGEVVVIKDGRPDFSAVLRRNFLSNPPQGLLPVSYVIFDILCWKGKDVRVEPLAVRQQILEGLQIPCPGVTVIDNFNDGEKLFNLTTERGWEGIVAKDLASAYTPGKSPHWRKVKNKQTGVFQVVGYTTNQGQLASLLIGKDFGKGLVLTGSVGSGLRDAGKKTLLEILQGLSVLDPPVPVKGRKDWHWVKPLLQAEVVFLEWTDSLTLRAPVFKTLLLEGKRYELP